MGDVGVLRLFGSDIGGNVGLGGDPRPIWPGSPG